MGEVLFDLLHGFINIGEIPKLLIGDLLLGEPALSLDILQEMRAVSLHAPSEVFVSAHPYSYLARCNSRFDE